MDLFAFYFGRSPHLIRPATVCVYDGDNAILDAATEFERVVEDKTEMYAVIPPIELSITIDGVQYNGWVEALAYDLGYEANEMLMGVRRTSDDGRQWYIVLTCPEKSEDWQVGQFCLIAPANKRLRLMWM
jgi:hypothetical protein